MQFETWIKLTQLTGKPRSKYLKGVDEALQQYHKAVSEANLSKLKLALHHWKMSKGYDGAAGMPGWMVSPRNHQKGPETLDLQTLGVNGRLTPVLADLADSPFYGIEAWAGEALARNVMKEARLQALQELFQGKKVIIRKGQVSLMLISMKRNLTTATTEAGKAAAAAEAIAISPLKQKVMEAVQPLVQQAETAARQLINEILAPFPLEVAREVLRFLVELMPQFLTELAGAIAPYLGLATSGIEAVIYTGKTIAAQYRLEQSDKHKEGFAKGDPIAALEAVQRMIERERNRCLRIASLQASDAVVKAAAHIADAAAFGAPAVSSVVSPLSGMAKALALLAHKVYLLARDVSELFQANRILLTQPRLTADLFDECPLLGCYFVAASTTSDLVNFAVDNIGAVGWNLEVETMVTRHIHPMVSMARDVIAESRLEVEGLEQSKAASANTTRGAHGISNVKDRVKKKTLDKINAVLPFRETLHRAQTPLQPTAKLGFQPVLAPVLQSRIYGAGR
jgi:hypothetical protein